MLSVLRRSTLRKGFDVHYPGILLLLSTIIRLDANPWVRTESLLLTKQMCLVSITAVTSHSL